MASSSMTASNSRQIIIGYECSKCKNPIIAVLTAHAKATVYYAYSTEKRIRGLIHELLEEGLSHEYSRVYTCKREQSFLGEYDPKQRRVRGSEYLESGIVDANYKCPLCMNTEPWQSKDSPIPKEKGSYPAVFDSTDKAKVWASAIIEEKRTQIETDRRFDPKKLKDLKYLYETELKGRYEGLFDRRRSLPEQAVYDNLLLKASGLDKYIAALGLKDLKKKLAASKEKKKLHKELIKTHADIKQKKEELSEQMAPVLADILEALPYINGCAPGICALTEKNASCCLLLPNDLPLL